MEVLAPTRAVNGPGEGGSVNGVCIINGRTLFMVSRQRSSPRYSLSSHPEPLQGSGWGVCSGPPLVGSRWGLLTGGHSSADHGHRWSLCNRPRPGPGPVLAPRGRPEERPPAARPCAAREQNPTPPEAAVSERRAPHAEQRRSPRVRPTKTRL